MQIYVYGFIYEDIFTQMYLYICIYADLFMWIHLCRRNIDAIYYIAVYYFQILLQNLHTVFNFQIFIVVITIVLLRWKKFQNL